jgi:hypothetical protein
MASFGRFICVLLPFLLTLASLVAWLVAGLAGMTDKGLFMFEINTTNLQLSPSSVSKILEGGAGVHVPSLNDLNIPKIGQRQAGNGNITAAQLGFDDIYDVNLWNYCHTAHNGTRDCTKPSINWAESALNVTTGNINSMLTSTGMNVTLPKDITDAVKAFGTVSKWTQIVFIIGAVALGVELFFGLFANCSRIFSCLTWIIGLATAVVVGAGAGLATATSLIVTGAVKGTAKQYGVDAHFNVRFLVAVWIAAAFAIAAALFWMFTICCCAPDHSSRRHSRARGADAEKFMPGGATGYARISDPHGGYAPQGAGAGAGYAAQSSYGPAHQHTGAYEPYSHAHV